MDTPSLRHEGDRRTGDRRACTRGGRRATDVPKHACPECGHRYSFVVDTNGIKRRRECDGCHHRYNTTETIDAIDQNPISGGDKMIPAS
jgi:transcription elongation factor Elf1